MSTFIHPNKYEVVQELGQPENIIIEDPYGWHWAGIPTVDMSAEEFMFSLPDGFIVKKVGWYGTDYTYFGVWRK